MVLDSNKQERRTYYTDVGILESMGILPDELRKVIPKSTLYNFRKRDYNEVFGIELATDSHQLSHVMKLIKAFAKDHKAQKVYRAALRVKNVLLAIKEQQAVGLARSEDSIKKKIVDTIDRVKKILGFERVLRYFKISRATFFAWKSRFLYWCGKSVLGRCFKRSPQQLTLSEIKTIKELCEDKRFRWWPIASIAYFAMRSGILNVSLGTWYKYVKILGIERKKAKSRRKKKKKGIRASGPNRIWHADVTEFKTSDNVKAYIYLIVDNYSRFILNWKVSLTLSGEIRKETFRQAFDRYIRSNQPGPVIDVMTDGGPENVNATVDEFLSQPDVSLRRVIAMKDNVNFSNSMVERVNMLVKYQSLFRHDISDFEALIKHLDEFIPEYNILRPHISLKGSTPYEVFKEVDLGYDELRSELEKAKTERVAYNRTLDCVSLGTSPDG